MKNKYRDTVLKKNQIYRAVIDGYTSEGAGIARIEGMAVFVPAAARGDDCDIRILKVAKNHAYGRIEKLHIPAACRVEPECDAYPVCGGCTLRHVRYGEELDMKTQRVHETLRRIGGVDVALAGTVPSPLKDAYRNKAQFPVGVRAGEIVTGFYRTGSRDIVPAAHCPIQSNAANRISAAVRMYMQSSGEAAYDGSSGVRHIYVRSSESTGEALCCIITAADSLLDEQALVRAVLDAEPGTVGVLLNTNETSGNIVLGSKTRVLYGRDYILDRLGGLTFRISLHSFYQINARQTEALYACARDFALEGLGEPPLLVDLYCGVGTIGLYMAGQVRQIIGVEVVAAAVEDARQNAQENGIGNARFLCADAGEAAQTLADEGLAPDVIVVDPPRKGLDAQTIDAACSMAPARIVYVSCDVATLARDVKIFAERGYAVQKLRAFDMFPRTGHVECVVLMSRVEK